MVSISLPPLIFPTILHIKLQSWKRAIDILWTVQESNNMSDKTIKGLQLGDIMVTNCQSLDVLFDLLPIIEESFIKWKFLHIIIYSPQQTMEWRAPVLWRTQGRWSSTSGSEGGGAGGEAVSWPSVEVSVILLYRWVGTKRVLECRGTEKIWE